MAVNVFPAPSTGPAIPGGLRSPEITYNTSYSLTGLSGITSSTGSSNAMAYRPTDNTLYFLVSGSNNLFKFNLSSNTGSAVSGGAPGGASGFKDIICAQDGTLYAGESSTGTSNGYYYYSTNGTSWTGIGNVLVNYRGFFSLVDSGQFSDVTGNIVWQSAGQSSWGNASDYPRLSINNSTASGINLEENFWSSVISYIPGGRADFPLRDGDDSPAGSARIYISSGNTSPVNVTVNGMGYGTVFQNCNIGMYRTTSNDVAISRNVVPISYVRNTSNTAEVNTSPAFIGKPTTIQNRWIVGVTRMGNGPALAVFDSANQFNLVDSFPITTPSWNGIQVDSYDFSNPIYISATKKLYVFAARYDAGVGNARMYEYDVTTY